MPYIGAGGKEYMSSVLAKASMPGGYTTTTTTGTSQPNWLSSLVQSSQVANIANKQREMEIRGLYDEIIRRYQPGGAFEAKSLAELDRLKKRSVTEQYGQSEQQAISGGIFGVQRPTRAGMGMKWEEQVGAPARLSLEDVLMQRLTSAQTGMAGFLERIQDVGPSLSDIYSMAQAGQSSATSVPISTGSGSGGLPSMQEFGANITAVPGAGGTGGTVTRASAGLTPKSLPTGTGGTGGTVTGTGTITDGTTSKPTTPYPNYASYVSASKAAGGKPYSESWARRMRVIP